MIFSSLQYMLFLPVVVFLYWRLQGHSRRWMLLLASFFFYMSWLPAYGLLLLFLTGFTWFTGLAISLARESGAAARARWLTIFGLVINLGGLVYYKYTNFFLANLAVAYNFLLAPWLAPMAAVPDNISAPVLNIILPLGISFFVFEFVHYLVDVARGDKPVASFLDFSVFAAFFPSQIAGPIKRYQEFIDSLNCPLPWSKELFFQAMTLILQGLFKKVAIADPLGLLIQHSYSTLAPISTADALFATFGFTVQIFCDFSGYTDIGRGSALLMGIKLPNNFALPFLAMDLTECWRRWHQSLSFWIRDYVFIPLGGSRCGPLRAKWNVFLTMCISGLWHGASWQFIIWGGLHGLGLIVNGLWRQLLDNMPALASLWRNRFGYALSTATTFCFFAFCFVFFRATDLPHTWNIFSGYLNFHVADLDWAQALRSGVLQCALIYCGFWILTDGIKSKRGDEHELYECKLLYPDALRFASWTAACLLVLAMRPTQATPFIYFQF